MEAIIIVCVAAAAVCAIVSGVWVASALVSAISADRNEANKESSNHTDS